MSVRTIFLALALSAGLLWLGGCGGKAGAPAPSVSAEFQRLCRAVGARDGKISRDQFLAQARDRETAARLFDACDLNRDAFVTQEEVGFEQVESLQRQVIRLTSPKH